MSNENYIEIQKEIESYGFTIVAKGFKPPWGAFLAIKEKESKDFTDKFFDGIDVSTLPIGGKLSPKILIAKLDARLSWQYDHRSAEIWQVYNGEVGVITSDNVFFW